MGFHRHWRNGKPHMAKTTDADRLKKISERRAKLDIQEKALKLRAEYKKAMEALKKK